MNNKIVEIQDTIFKQIKRLDDNAIMNNNGRDEIARANAISNASTSFIKSINVQLAIFNIASRLEKSPETLAKELGLCEEE